MGEVLRNWTVPGDFKPEVIAVLDEAAFAALTMTERVMLLHRFVRQMTQAFEALPRMPSALEDQFVELERACVDQFMNDVLAAKMAEYSEGVGLIAVLREEEVPADLWEWAMAEDNRDIK